jgi:hypothetical protein
MHFVLHIVVLRAFVHGLAGDRDKPWSVKYANAPWLQSLLPSKVPNARIDIFGYSTSVADVRRMNTIARRGHTVTNTLRVEILGNGGSATEGTC